MFILDSLMISGIRWALETALTAAEAEMNDDSVLREQLLEAEMRREMGEISDDRFQEIEADLLARIREIKARRDGGAGPLAFGSAEPMAATADSTFQVEASVSGDFHEPASAHATVIDTVPIRGTLGGVVNARGLEQIAVLDLDGPLKPAPSSRPARARVKATPASRRVTPAKTANARARTARTARTTRTTRTKK